MGDSKARLTNAKGEKFGVDTRAGTERFNLLYSDAFRRADDRKTEIERQESILRRKMMLVSVHAGAHTKPWTKDEIKEVSERMHEPRKKACNFMHVNQRLTLHKTRS